ncbi:MAG: hypothetical protein FIA97_04635 [Methylococcaceae bacterium]|nr:hypothetical protein [Methylococcaceae bacterium]
MNTITRSFALLVVAAASQQSQALTPVTQGTPFQIVGYLQSFTLDSPGDPLSAAKMVVNGVTITLPRNTIIGMPATYLTPSDVFDTAPAGVTQKNPAAPAGQSGCPNPGGAKGSGLALDDCPPPPTGYEVAVDGNIVGTAYIAGNVHISQQSLNNGAGYIKAIDTATGMLCVGPDPAPAAGLDHRCTVSPTQQLARVRINDPVGRYGLATRNNAATAVLDSDPRFTSDSDNPTVHAKTGYPLCVPRSASDPECPAKNRPGAAGGPQSFFVMGPTPLGPPSPGQPAIPNCPACDPAKQAPLVVGDYINYLGTFAKDKNGMSYISAHTVDAWLGIFTEPNKAPAYVSQEVSLVGVGDAFDAIPNVDQEVAPRDFKVEGFTTDPGRNIEVSAVLIDPASGAACAPSIIGEVPPEAVPFGRFRFIIKRAKIGRRPPAGIKGTVPTFVVVDPMRELVVSIKKAGSAVNDHQLDIVNDVAQGDLKGPGKGLNAGEYHAPVAEYIYAENTFFGDPLIPLNFHRFPHLAEGSGPLTTLGRAGGPVVGPLAPWPGGPGTPNFGLPAPTHHCP